MAEDRLVDKKQARPMGAETVQQRRRKVARDLDRGVKVKVIAEKYGLSHQAVYKIRKQLTEAEA